MQNNDPTVVSTHPPLPRAAYGATAFAPGKGRLPDVFPREMGPNTVAYLMEVAESGLTSNMVERFERTLANYHGVGHCIATPGCTQALFATMLAMDFAPGDEIIVSPIADYGTIAGMLFENYIPVFADTEAGEPHISARTIAPNLTDRTRAIICVHKLGVPCDMGPIIALARQHNLLVIEDVCQAILATDRGRLAGTIGDIGCFSFDAEKTCGGDIGGAILTDDEAVAERIRHRAIARGASMVPGFGRTHFYRGFATRMPQCTAATCLANFEILPRQIANRQRTAALLNAAIDDIAGLHAYHVPDGRTHTYWLYGFRFDAHAFTCSADQFAAALVEAGLTGAKLGRYYLLPQAVQFLDECARAGKYPFSQPPASRQYHYRAEDTPEALALLESWIFWPWTEKYTDDHVDVMADIIRAAAARYRR